MKKTVLVFGLIAGTIAGGMFFVTAPFWESGMMNFENGTLVGYATMVIALSLVFFGIRACRENHQQGVITFGRAFKVGMLITLIASVMYAVGWEVSYHTVNEGFMEKYAAHYIEKMKEEGASPEELAQMKTDWDAMLESYTNPLVRFSLTMMEILPVGIVISLVSAALLRKR